MYTKQTFKCVYQVHISVCIPSTYFSVYNKQTFQCVHQPHISVRIPSTHFEPNFEEWVNYHISIVKIRVDVFYCSIMKVFEIAHDTSSGLSFNNIPFIHILRTPGCVVTHYSHKSIGCVVTHYTLHTHTQL